jgi:hypothetical protein
MTRATSLDAYRALQDSGKELTQCARIALYVERHEGCTRRQVAAGLGMEEARVSARCRKLIQDGVVYEKGSIIDATGHSAMKLFVKRAVMQPEQVELRLAA